MDAVKPVKTAIIGCGMISNIYIKNLNNLFQIIDLAAICDLNQTAAEEKAKLYGVERIATTEEILRDPEIEMVVNLTNPAAHYAVIRQALEAGKHVYTEKTLAANLEQARDLVKIAREKDLYLGVAPDTILGAGIQTAKKVIDAGMIGQVTSCFASINRNQSLNSESFRMLRNPGGCLPYDVGIYYIAALLCLLGPVQQVTGFGAPAPEHTAQMFFNGEMGRSWQIPGNNLIAGAIKFSNGILGSVHFNGNAANTSHSQLMIFGTEGTLELGDPNTFCGAVKLIKPETGECLIPHSHGYDGTPVLPEPSVFDRAYGHRGVGAAEMAWAIRMHRPNRCSKELGLHAMEILEGMDRSAETGGSYSVESTFSIRPLCSGYLSTTMDGQGRGDAEMSLVN